MLKIALLTLFALVIAVGGGGGSVWYELDTRSGVGAINVGPWTGVPDIGTPDADPYSKARMAREGVLALGQGEGLSFVAKRDSTGDPLRRECAYKIVGEFPVARFWTLYAADLSLDTIQTGGPRGAVLQSYEILHQADDSIVISAGSRPVSGNWLFVNGTGAMYFVLTFYDTPLATNIDFSDVTLPSIRKAGCNA